MPSTRCASAVSRSASRMSASSPAPGRCPAFRHPRHRATLAARVPVYDFTLQRPIEDEERYYAILGRTKVDQTIDSLKVNRLVAYDKSTCQRVWSSESWREPDSNLCLPQPCRQGIGSGLS